MDDDIFPDLCDNNPLKTYTMPAEGKAKSDIKPDVSYDCTQSFESREPLTTKNAVKYLLEGKLKSLVCRYCLNVDSSLSELDQIFHIAGATSTFKVTIRDMVASFHPVQVAEGPDTLDKICDQCLNRTLSSYLFKQKCEQAERALRNCLLDIHEKVDKLDPLERQKKRGRQKMNPNYNIIHAEHQKVIDYAEPIINIINIGAEPYTDERVMTDLECKKCWQVLPNMESLLNHEKTHPNTMWYHCRPCGRSFPKRHLFNKHYHRIHVLGKEPQKSCGGIFECNKCGYVANDYKQHLQHMEKHKFKIIMEHVVHNKMHRLCTVCLDKRDSLIDLDRMVCIHGGYPELMGDKTLQAVLASTLPDMTNLQNFTGTKVCNKCLNHAITSYIFINQFSYSRERLDVCVTHMLKNVENLQPHANLFVQISDDTIMPIKDDVDETLILNENDFVDESKLKVDFLEDEFRVKSDSENINSEVNAVPEQTVRRRKKWTRQHKSLKEVIPHKPAYNVAEESPLYIDELLENPAKNVTKTYVNRKLVNGVQSNKYNDVCSEFLTFNKRPKRKFRYTCPLCSKHFISVFFLECHVRKHAAKTVACDICERTFRSKFYLFEHKTMRHLLERTDHFTCKDCGRKFLTAEKLKMHQSNHKMKSCDLCHKVYATQKYYEIHMQRHAAKLRLLSRRRIQTCSFCEKECANDNQLSIHVNKIHFQIKPYGCDMCDSQFYTQRNLQNHKKVHNMPCKETCLFCSKILKNRNQLVTHVRKHIGCKPFSCPVCNQSFYSQSKAWKHMKVYHGGRFCCGVCKTTFVSKHRLKEHVNTEHSFI